MTLIANFTVNNYPVIMGDLMLSNEMLPRTMAEGFNIPTAENVNKRIPVSIWNTVSGLRQKVVVFKNKFALAWSGSLDDAAKVISNIECVINESEFTHNELKNYFDKQVKGIKNDLYLTGMVFDIKTLEGEKFAWSSKKGYLESITTNNLFGEIYVGGSGRDDFLRLAYNISQV